MADKLNFSGWPKGKPKAKKAPAAPAPQEPVEEQAETETNKEADNG